MKTQKDLVKMMFMNILTAGVFAIGLTMTACSDEMSDARNDKDKVPAGADTRILEAYGLMYTDFESENDVQILDADTTEIAVSKKLADKLGIASFVGHPMGIWQAIDELPYARKAKEERLVGDTYILKVERATVAELIGEKSAKLSTAAYVNDKPQLLTRNNGGQFSEYGAKYVDEAGIIHPAVIHLTDPEGYDEPIHKVNNKPLLKNNAAVNNGHYKFYTAEDLVGGTTRGALGASMHVNVLSLSGKISFDHDFHVSAAPGDTLSLSGQIPIDYNVNYFMTLEGGVRWSSWLPEVYVKKFETGLDGNYSFSPECYLSWRAKVNLKKELERLTLATFGQYTFTFVVGVVPVCIVVKPSLYMKFNAGVEGGARIGFKYEYASRFKAGIRYQDGWSVIKEFEELKNDFKLVKPEAFFTVDGGVGFYLGVDVMIYGVAGPEIGIGPNLGTKLSCNVRPFEDKKEDIFDFKASVDLKIHAFAGAKLSVLGYDLAKWSTEVKLAGPWTLFKYPSDGTEHKDPDAKKQEEKNALWGNVVQAMANGSQQFIEEYEDMITQLINMNGWTRETAITETANTIMKNQPITDADLRTPSVMNWLRSSYNSYKTEVNERFQKWVVANHMSEMEILVRGNRAFKTYSKRMKGWAESIDFTEIGEEFQREYGRLPEHTSAELKALLEMTLRASEIYYNRHKKDTPMWGFMESYLDQHNWRKEYPQNVQKRAKFDTIFIWERYHKTSAENNANWEGMASDFNDNIRNINDILQAGVPIE